MDTEVQTRAEASLDAALALVNPYWDYLIANVPQDDGRSHYSAYTPKPNTFGILDDGTYGEVPYDARTVLTSRYSWAIPSPGSLAWVVTTLDGKGLIEVGAGTGYWDSMLTQLGVDAVAYDIHPPDLGDNVYHHGGSAHERPTTYHPVSEGSLEALDDHVDRALFLSWPPYNSSFAHDALSRYQGDLVIYCGEWTNGCTGGDDFFQLLGDEWEQEDSFADHTSWGGIYDGLYSYRRKTPATRRQAAE